jgi:hypothetical protein
MPRPAPLPSPVGDAAAPEQTSQAKISSLSCPAESTRASLALLHLFFCVFIL